jgi:hypothetical protein
VVLKMMGHPPPPSFGLAWNIMFQSWFDVRDWNMMFQWRLPGGTAHYPRRAIAHNEKRSGKNSVKPTETYR